MTALPCATVRARSRFLSNLPIGIPSSTVMAAAAATAASAAAIVVDRSRGKKKEEERGRGERKKQRAVSQRNSFQRNDPSSNMGGERGRREPEGTRKREERKRERERTRGAIQSPDQKGAPWWSLLGRPRAVDFPFVCSKAPRIYVTDTLAPPFAMRMHNGSNSAARVTNSMTDSRHRRRDEPLISRRGSYGILG